ncbi:MAG: cadherin-like beta sandwich domain-containing protein, partial [Sphingobacteriaceae bacterium]
MEKPLPLSQKRSFSLRSVLAFLLLMVLLSASQRSNAQVYYLMTSPNVQEGTKLITAGATLKTPEDVLKRVDKDGSNDADVISSVAKSPSKVALDGNNNRVFIYEALNTEKSIKIFNLTTGAALGSIDVSYEVRGMVYDPVSDYLYYITEGGDGGKLSVGDAIYRVRGDGTGNEVFLSSITINPYAIKLDIKGKRLFVYQSNWNKRMLYTYDIGTKSLTASREFANKLTYVNGVDYDETEDFFYYIVPSNTGTKIEAGDLLMRQKSDGTRDSVLMTAFLYNPINVVVNKANNRIFINDGYYANAKIISVNATNYTITDTVKKLPRSNWGAPFWALNDITAPHYAVLSSTNATAVSSASATLGGNLVYGFGLSTERGIVYSSTKALPTVADNKLSIVTNTSNAAFSSNVSGLSPSTTYYARAYAVNSAGTVYGDVVSFSTTSNNANLSSLSLSAGTLSPTFAAGTTSYTANVAYSVNSVTLTPAREQANATIEVAGTPVTSGTASAAYSLSTGENIINTIVTAQDGTKKTYTVTVTRGQTPQAITFAAFP